MAGTKRTSPESVDDKRAAKAAKTDPSSGPSQATKRRAPKTTKAPLPAAKFKAMALPIHANITHTPPTIADEEEQAESNVIPDAGLIGTVTLVPSTFSTGSYGWKGSKKITVELQNAGDGKEKPKVQVMLSINATVVGSKQAKSGDDEETKGDEDNNEEPEEVAGEEEGKSEEPSD